GKIDLSKIKSTNTKEKENSESKNNTNINDLINVLKKELENKISNVVVSNRLTKSPIILIADESGMDINMEKLMKMHNKTMPDSKKILEINPNHPMILKLSESLSKIDHKKLSSLLLDQANILDGNVLSNPTNYIESLTELFIK
ncbi:MAG: molecular chaperone HtpG, partial [Pelagibacteraceae bacterium]|nr:molecular chaperone HtpG [Pelagibacteraceae bacterium]